MMHSLKTLMIVVASCGLVLSCSGQKAQKTTLRVNLFPYLPDAASDRLHRMAARIKSKFEKQNPSINLEVTLDENNDFYSLENYRDW
jgi:thiamine pyridinylase